LFYKNLVDTSYKNFSIHDDIVIENVLPYKYDIPLRVIERIFYVNRGVNLHIYLYRKFKIIVDSKGLHWCLLTELFFINVPCDVGIKKKKLACQISDH
jgi:hypothetical protein